MRIDNNLKAVQNYYAKKMLREQYMEHKRNGASGRSRAKTPYREANQHPVRAARNAGHQGRIAWPASLTRAPFVAITRQVDDLLEQAITGRGRQASKNLSEAAAAVRALQVRLKRHGWRNLTSPDHEEAAQFLTQLHGHLDRNLAKASARADCCQLVPANKH